MNLRPYQERAIEEIRDAIRGGRRRIMLTVPTGGGKTLTSACMIASAVAKGKRALFVAHRLELIDQTVATFARLGVRAVGVIRAKDRRRDSSQPIQVASIQTLCRRTQPDYDLVIVDEAHRATASTYTKHVFERHERAVIIGLSATPIRSDGRPLGTHFEEPIITGARYSELIAEGHLAEPAVYSTPVLPDLSKVRTTGGDYNAEDLEAAMNKGALIGDLVTQWSKHPRQRTVAFAVSVAHSRAIVDQFRAAGVRAEHLDGTTPEEERRAILQRLATFETELVSNVGVLCEGWDLPPCKTLILARPTKSLGLYMQMGGRILRPWENVTPIILDHGGNVDRHGLPHEDRTWSLTKKAKKQPGAPRLKVCTSCFGYVAAGCKTCPLCGAVLIVETAAAPTELPAVPVDLELRTLDGDAAQLAFFRATHKRARERGWKPGAVMFAFRDRFGTDPPAGWWSALQRDARRDDEWKAKIAARKVRGEDHEAA